MAQPALSEGAPSPRACSGCGGTDLTTLPMALTDGTPVVFVSCQRCEQREWLTADEDGGWSALPIETVLSRSTKRRP